MQVGPLAGRIGEEFVGLLAAEGLRGEWTWVSGNTRTNITIVSEADRVDTIINESGPELTPDDWRSISETIVGHARPGIPVCVSGSVPAGVTAGNLTEVLCELAERDIPVIVDASGWALVAMLEARPWCAKFNHLEASGLLGISLESIEQVGQAAVEILDRVTGLVVITMGARGAVVATKKGQVFHVTPPMVDAKSGVGSGDTFLGAVVVALYGLNYGEVDAVVFASAAGALNATTTRQGIVDFERVVELSGQCVIDQLTPVNKGG
jgi:1-phosphofructokinase family hexose kinase